MTRVLTFKYFNLPNKSKSPIFTTEGSSLLICPIYVHLMFSRCIINGYEEQQNKAAVESTINLLKPTGHVMHQQFNIQQLYVLPTLCLCVLYLSENKQRLVPLTA